MRNSILFIVSVLAACATNPTKTTGGGGGGGGGGGSGSDGSGSGSGGDITPQEFVEQLVTQECQHAWSCMSQFPATSTDTFGDDWGSSQADCVQQDDDFQATPEIVAAIAKGTITWDPAMAPVCLANMAFPASCTDFFANYDFPSACYDALSGNVADGGACTTDWECSGDNSVCTNAKCAPDTTM